MVRRISGAILRAGLWSALAGALIAFAIWLRTSPELRPGFPVATWFGLSCALAFVPSLAMELGVTHLLLHLGPAVGEKGRACEATMMVLVRALTYATLFIGFVLVFLPAQVLSAAGVARPARFGALQLAGMIVGAVGAGVALWCIFTFAVVGRGTPAPFDPPRRLVVRGPYRYVRNPMYVGAALALAGAALFYETSALWAYAGGFLLLMHLFVVLYEEPTLRQTFGEDYETYCRQVRRWWPTA